MRLKVMPPLVQPAGKILHERQVTRSEIDSLDLLIDVATRHYLHGNSQIEIARDLNLDPSTISRYLKRARDEGIVKIEIVAPRRANVEMARALTRELGIGRVLVAELRDEDDDPLTAAASVAARFTSDQLRRGTRIGIAWGETLAAVVRHLDSEGVEALHVAQLAGGLADAQPGIQGHELARQITEIFPMSRATYLHAPSIVDSAAIRNAFVADRSVQAALAVAARSEVALVGIGNMDPEATLLKTSHILGAERDALLAHGAVGSMNARFYDAKGQPVGHLDCRTVAIEWSDLAAIPTVIAVAAGERKADAIRGSTQTGCVDVLVTDERTAKVLLGRS
jgi:deoxyribonucleoside regulator